MDHVLLAQTFVAPPVTAVSVISACLATFLITTAFVKRAINTVLLDRALMVQMEHHAACASRPLSKLFSNLMEHVQFVQTVPVVVQQHQLALAALHAIQGLLETPMVTA